MRSPLGRVVCGVSLGWMLCSGCGAKTDLALVLGDSPPVDPDASTPNECGGNLPLADRPGAICGQCGTWVCEGPNALRCDDQGLNACGECGPLPTEQCNGYDDDCNGRTDERCVHRVGASFSTFAPEEIRISGARAAVVIVTQPELFRNVAVVDLATDRGVILDPAEATDHDIAIDGDIVAWLRTWPDTSPSAELWVHDLSTGISRRVDNEGIFGAGPPAVEAGRVAASAFTRREADIERIVAIWNLQTGVVQEVPFETRTGLRAWGSDLSGRWVVADECAANCRYLESSRLFAMDIETEEVVDLSHGLETRHVSPSIDGARIVWRSETPLVTGPAGVGESKLMLFDLGTRERSMLPTLEDRIVDGRPRVAGDFVCWTYMPDGGDLRYSNGLTVLSLASGRTLNPTHGPSVSCDLSADAVAWISFGASEARIRYFEAGEL